MYTGTSSPQSTSYNASNSCPCKGILKIRVCQCLTDWFTLTYLSLTLTKVFLLPKPNPWFWRDSLDYVRPRSNTCVWFINLVFYPVKEMWWKVLRVNNSWKMYGHKSFTSLGAALLPDLMIISLHYSSFCLKSHKIVKIRKKKRCLQIIQVLSRRQYRTQRFDVETRDSLHHFCLKKWPKW